MEEAIDRELIAHGVDITGLTEEQKYLLVEPSFAPENYAQDGELPVSLRKRYWVAKMQRAGIPDKLINQVKKIYR